MNNSLNPNIVDTPKVVCPYCCAHLKQDPHQTKAVVDNTELCPVCNRPLDISENGCFKVYRDKKDPFDIAYQWCPGKSNNEISDDQNKLLKALMKTNTIIKSLYFSDDADTCVAEKQQNDAIKEKYFDKLLSLAQVGLSQDIAQPKLATLALDELKKELTIVEGQRIKNTYMKELGLRAFLSSLIALMLFFITTTAIFPHQATLADLFFKKPTTIILFQNDFLAVISMFSIIWIGAMIGTWVSFAARNKAIDFVRLSILETDRMEPTIRLIYMGICAIIFSLILSSGIIALEVGGLSTANIASSIGTQFVIGLLCGLTESKIGVLVHETLTSALSRNKDQAQNKDTGVVED